jgi:hypothetical protein
MTTTSTRETHDIRDVRAAEITDLMAKLASQGQDGCPHRGL